MGLKPTIFGFGDQRFIQLSYGHTYFYSIKESLINQKLVRQDIGFFLIYH